jgi:hypothetical protein
MAMRYGQNERLILDTLKQQPSISMERLVTLVPDMTWNRVFQAVDTLSRAGDITIRRRGSDYELGLSAGAAPLS